MTKLDELKVLADSVVGLDRALARLSLVLPENEAIDEAWDEVQTAWGEVAAAQRNAVNAMRASA